MRAGRFRHFITVQQATETRDALGEPIPAWSTYAQFWAEVKPLVGREYFTAQQDVTRVTHRIACRYDSALTITAKMRVSWDSRFFDIEAVLNIYERDRELHLMCVEVQP